LNGYEVAPQAAHSARHFFHDVGVDALAEVGILRTHRISTELAATLARRLRCLARYERNTISDI
jgi:hypothetical protein